MTSATTVPDVVRPLPRRPFYFNTSAHLLRITRQKAETLNELLRALRSCPEDSIFQHTFRTLQEHHFIREGFSNDLPTGPWKPAMNRGWRNGWPVWMCASLLPLKICAIAL